jgi:hypothetical protein
MQHVELPHDDAGDPNPTLTSRASSIEEEVGHFPSAEGPNRHIFVYPIEVQIARALSAAAVRSLTGIAREGRRIEILGEHLAHPGRGQ